MASETGKTVLDPSIAIVLVCANAGLTIATAAAARVSWNGFTDISI
jgi:hypothetical protein